MHPDPAVDFDQEHRRRCQRVEGRDGLDLVWVLHLGRGEEAVDALQIDGHLEIMPVHEHAHDDDHRGDEHGEPAAVGELLHTTRMLLVTVSPVSASSSRRPQRRSSCRYIHQCLTSPASDRVKVRNTLML